MSNTKPNKLEGQVTAIDGKKICFVVEPSLEKIVEILFSGEDMPKIYDTIMLSRNTSAKQGFKISSNTPVDAAVYLQRKENNVICYDHIGTASIKYGDIDGKR